MSKSGGVFQIDDVTRTMSKGGGVRLVFHPSKFRPPPPGWLATGLLVLYKYNVLAELSEKIAYISKPFPEKSNLAHLPHFVFFWGGGLPTLLAET